MNMTKRLAALMMVFSLLLGMTALAEVAPEETKEPDLSAYVVPFDTTDVSGNRITAEILGQYDLTVINVWATTCGYCVMEIPELEKFYQQKPENVNFMAICMDGGYYPKVVAQMEEQYGITYSNLIPDMVLWNGLLADILGTPTTLFLDSKGNLVGDPIIGAPRDLLETYNAEVAKRLESIQVKE